MNGFVSFALHVRSELSAPFFGTTTAPFSPPFMIVAGVSSTRSPFASVALWQARQLRLKIGRICVSKSTFFCAAAGEAGTAAAKVFGVSAAHTAANAIAETKAPSFAQPRRGRLAGRGTDILSVRP